MGKNEQVSLVTVSNCFLGAGGVPVEEFVVGGSGGGGGEEGDLEEVWWSCGWWVKEGGEREGWGRMIIFYFKMWDPHL